MKFYGNIGFTVTANTDDDVWTPQITEKKYAGDVLRLQRNREGGEHINDGLRINTQISVLLDPWFQDHFSQIRYVEYMGSKWIAESLDIQYPRINITLGGLYHGDEPEPDDQGDSGEPEEGTQETTGEETEGDSGE